MSTKARMQRHGDNHGAQGSDPGGSLEWEDVGDDTGSSADGWVYDSETWTRTGSYTFTVPGDLTARFTKGTRIKATQTTAKYGTVASSSHSAGTTTVTLITNSDYTLAAAAITAPAHSYQANPQGYPGTFNWTPTFTGFSSVPSTFTANFSVLGNTIYCMFSSNNGTSNATTFTITLPVAAAMVTTGVDLDVFGGVYDNSAAKTDIGFGGFTNASNVLTFVINFNTNLWTASGAKHFVAHPFFYRF